MHVVYRIVYTHSFFAVLLIRGLWYWGIAIVPGASEVILRPVSPFTHMD